MSAFPGPRDEHLRRAARWRDRLARHTLRVQHLGSARLALFGLGVTGGLVLLKTHPELALLLALPIALFVALVWWHARERAARDRASRALAAHERALRRLDDDWSEDGPRDTGFCPEGHLFAEDIDLFGAGSLFQYLATGPTRLGQATLARWLTAAGPLNETGSRQAAVAELSDDLELFEALQLVVVGEQQAEGSGDLSTWPEAEHGPLPSWERPLAGVMALLALAAGTAWALGTTSPGPLGLVACCQALVGRLWARRHARLADAAREASHELPALAGVLCLLEQRQARSAGLTRLQTSLDTPHGSASARLARLARLLGALDDCEHNPLWAPLAFLAQRRVFLIHALQRWHTQALPSLPAWVAAAGEFEALVCLATYAREHPGNCYPELLEGDPRLEARGLGHPLIPRDHVVRNDIELGPRRRLQLVSGSNMSGKSTWLRTLGCNLVLARAGAPVVARSMRLSELELGTSIRLSDSLQQGVSRFYAEVSRLRAIDDLLRRSPGTLVLLDEILAGTNSADRLQGARAYVSALVRRGALTLVTTHDLALAAIVDELGELAENVHFADQIVEGKMHFDHRLRPGVVDHGNALQWMRSLGLQV